MPKAWGDLHRGCAWVSPPGSGEVPTKADWIVPCGSVPWRTLLFWVSEHHHLVLVGPKCHQRLVLVAGGSPGQPRGLGDGLWGMRWWLVLSLFPLRERKDALPASSWGTGQRFHRGAVSKSSKVRLLSFYPLTARSHEDVA